MAQAVSKKYAPYGRGNFMDGRVNLTEDHELTVNHQRRTVRRYHVELLGRLFSGEEVSTNEDGFQISGLVHLREFLRGTGLSIARDFDTGVLTIDYRNLSEAEIGFIQRLDYVSADVFEKRPDMASKIERSQREYGELNALMKKIEQGEEVDTSPFSMWVNIGAIFVDKNLQRDRGLKEVQALATDFVWKKFQPPSLGYIGGGIFYVPDGQKRFLSLMNRTDLPLVPAYVMPARTSSEQATMYLGANIDSKRLTSPEKFVGVVIEEITPSALELNELIESFGIELVSTKAKARGKNKTLTNISELARMQDRDRELPGKVLKVLSEGFPTDTGVPYSREIMRAIADLVTQFSSIIDLDLLGTNLGVYNNTTEFINAALGHENIKAITRVEAIIIELKKANNLSLSDDDPRYLPF